MFSILDRSVTHQPVSWAYEQEGKVKQSTVKFLWRKKGIEPAFTTGVSLHGHTFYSVESLDFIDRVTARVPVLSALVRKEKAKYRNATGCDLDLQSAWWTPPLSPRQAWDLERDQIERQLGMNALVSLSDHDNIDACWPLRVLEETRACPVSIEWTVPFRETFFHVGVHNLPADNALAMTRAMNEFTAAPEEARISPILEWLGASRGVLIILNHPLWDESHIGEAKHIALLGDFLTLFAPFLHALELNGLRPWRENMQAMQVGERFGLPVVSGGDRHGREPNACVNLTHASTFSEFAVEVRTGQVSHIVFFPRYREPLKMRVLENLIDILEDDPHHALGWTDWRNRVFYRNEEGTVRSLHEIWGGKVPAIVAHFIAVKRFLRNGTVQSALRVALSERQEFAL